MLALLSPKQLLMLFGLASAALLLAAFGFEYLGGLAPCKLCLWQRWPHAGIIIFSLFGGVGILRLGPAFLLVALTAAVTAGIAGYHVGVEQKFWQGPAGCSITSIAMNTPDLLDILMATPVVRCDEVTWSFASISMAGWNMLFSCGLGGSALLAYRKFR